jgi:hypothetical protein
MQMSDSSWNPSCAAVPMVTHPTARAIAAGEMPVSAPADVARQLPSVHQTATPVSGDQQGCAARACPGRYRVSPKAVAATIVLRLETVYARGRFVRCGRTAQICAIPVRSFRNAPKILSLARPVSGYRPARGRCGDIVPEFVSEHRKHLLVTENRYGKKESSHRRGIRKARPVHGSACP